MTEIAIHNRIARDDLALGLVLASGVGAGPAPAALAAALDDCIALRRAHPLATEEERVRQGCRDMLRNGRYKPTGRGKPASEYLLREATESGDRFPRISGPVDANNLVSLAQLLPISLWDLELAAATDFEFRLGRGGESYVFNATGQALELADLVCGCALAADGGSRPIVTPIKDSLATKLTERSRDLAGCIYYPLAAGSAAALRAASEELLRWLLACGDAGAKGARAVALPGESVSLGC
jgi:DNA/RNA-binding domain of Phe-tRNA-synthetase-like protein